ncbi:MAG: hypothetical protein C5B49_10555 [Bdellovibrio sp.]|nr:MAG: hypothetical protein C5B49_10555 [Bdellovibrio sp.]
MQIYRDIVLPYLQRRLVNIHFEVETRAEWGSDRPHFREQLSQATGRFAEFSISHARGLGGFAAIGTESWSMVPLGFDIEESVRLRPDLVARIAVKLDDARPAGLNMSFIWSAKEASFKALHGDDQPSVITGISLRQWHELEKGVWEFHFYAGESLYSSGFGVVWSEPPYQFSLCFRTRHS